MIRPKYVVIGCQIRLTVCRKGLSAIINLQLPGEHASCGDGVHDEEFSYRQQQFMDASIFFYNFGWWDSVPHVQLLADRLKIAVWTTSKFCDLLHYERIA